jgi:hypothetical protein
MSQSNHARQPGSFSVPRAVDLNLPRFSPSPMQSTKTTLFLVSISLLFSGCAGTDFTRPAAETLTIGVSKKSDVLRVMGEPKRTGQVLKNSASIDQLIYVYASKVGSEPLHQGATPARAMVYSIYNDVLVGKQFDSSFKEDATDFDGAKASAVVKGKTTKPEIIAMFGQPSGEAIYPILDRQDVTAVVYLYSEVTGSVFHLKFRNKMLTVTFDKQDVVVDVQYVESGNK